MTSGMKVGMNRRMCDEIERVSKMLLTKEAVYPEGGKEKGCCP